MTSKENFAAVKLGPQQRNAHDTGKVNDTFFNNLTKEALLAVEDLFEFVPLKDMVDYISEAVFYVNNTKEEDEDILRVTNNCFKLVVWLSRTYDVYSDYLCEKLRQQAIQNNKD